MIVKIALYIDQLIDINGHTYKYQANTCKFTLQKSVQIIEIKVHKHREMERKRGRKRESKVD